MADKKERMERMRLEKEERKRGLIQQRKERTVPNTMPAFRPAPETGDASEMAVDKARIPCPLPLQAKAFSDTY
jgi:hypothetical protein